jgi:hypothetical protein
LGKPMEINVTLDSGLKPPAESEMALPMMGIDTAPPAEPAPEEDFYNDPLIKSAMEIFKATLA